MKAEICEMKEISEVKTKYGLLKEGRNESLNLENDHFRIDIFSKDEETYISLRPTIHRPGHDHDNCPTIRLIIPENGLQDSGVNSKYEQRNGRLIIETDSGHINLDVTFANYVWNKFTGSFWDIYNFLEKKTKEGNK